MPVNNKKCNKMKKVLNILLLISVISISLKSQVYYNNSKNEETALLLKNGLTFIKTGDVAYDNAIIDALEKYWTVVSYKVKSKGSQISEDDFVIYETTYSTSGQVKVVDRAMGIVKASHLKEGRFYMTNYSGYIAMNGFNQKSSNEELAVFMGYIIKGLNDCVDIVNKEKLKGYELALFRAISDALNPKVNSVKSKTFLIIGDTKDFIDLKKVEKSGLKYKFISDDEFKSLSENELSKYAIIYFKEGRHPVVSVYDAKTRALVFTNFYQSMHYKFDNRDTKAIMKQF